MNQNRPDCPPGPPSPPPHPLTCALVLAEQVRSERGRIGVEQYVRSVGPLLPPTLAEELSRRLQPPARLRLRPTKSRRRTAAAILTYSSC